MLKLDPLMSCFLDETLITSEQKGGTRDWLCPAQCRAEKVYWKEIIENQIYQRYTQTATTTLMLQPKLYQVGDLIRSSERPEKISITLEGKVTCNPSITTKPHHTYYFSTKKLKLSKPDLSALHEVINGKPGAKIAKALTDIYEENIEKDFVYKSQWQSLEVTAAKIHFEN